MNKKTVAILLATYNPPSDWLDALLDSLNGQSYPQLHLYVRDDGSTPESFSALQRQLQLHITAFPYTLLQNEKNMGSNGTFGALVKDCCEDYICFCDQDDVWYPEKIENGVRLLESSPLSPVLVCSEVAVIDGEGNPVADKISTHRKRHVYLRGNALAPTFINRNFVMGCTVVMERTRALSYLPFPDGVVHDHYIAFRASLEGAIDFLDEPQMDYRVYGGNQTGVMSGVASKEDYYTRRIEVFSKRVRCFSAYADLLQLQEARAWCDSREQNFHREKGGFRALWRMRSFNRVTSLFELFALRFPAPLFRFAIRMVQKGFL